MKYAFTEAKRMTKANKLIVQQANEIIAERQAQGYTLTLRQLFYAFVTRGLIANKQENYKRLGGVIDEGRKQGLIDWAAFEDRERPLHKMALFDSPVDYLTRTREWFEVDPWKDQDVYCEVWIEKNALIGVIRRPCEEFRVPYFGCRGYVSSSALYDAGRRLRQKHRKGQQVIIFHLGDHDPSGIDMTRNNQEMLRMYAETDRIEVRRLAMHMEQIEEYNLPPNPAKESDSRFAEYQIEFGDSSWELDALDPQMLEQLVSENIEGVLDRELYDEALAQEDTYRDEIADIANNYEAALAAARSDT